MREDRMFKVKILYDVPEWSYYWRYKALEKYAPSNFIISGGDGRGQVYHEDDFDLVLQMCYSYTKTQKEYIILNKKNTKLISIFTIGWNHANEYIPDCIKYSDRVIMTNYDIWSKNGKNQKTKYISNGVDLDIFKIKIPTETRKHKVLWIGSEGHRTVKNYDSIIIPLKELLLKNNVDFDFKLINSTGTQKLNQDQMCDWYNSGTLFIMSSSREGTPNPLLESAACGCVPISTSAGIAPELINDTNGLLCDISYESIYNNINVAIKNYDNFSKNMKETIKGWSWEIKSKQYFDLFKEVILESNI